MLFFCKYNVLTVQLEIAPIKLIWGPGLAEDNTVTQWVKFRMSPWTTDKLIFINSRPKSVLFRAKVGKGKDFGQRREYFTSNLIMSSNFHVSQYALQSRENASVGDNVLMPMWHSLCHIGYVIYYFTAYACIFKENFISKSIYGI